MKNIFEYLFRLFVMITLMLLCFGLISLLWFDNSFIENIFKLFFTSLIITLFLYIVNNLLEI